jgi:NhaP-type Na+/H+ or K+/H+ antiporter
LWEVAAAVLLGSIISYVAGRLLLWAEAKQTIEKQSFLAYTVALSLAVLGGVKLLGSDGILAVFAAGTVFSMVVGGSERAEEEGVQEAVEVKYIRELKNKTWLKISIAIHRLLRQSQLLSVEQQYQVLNSILVSLKKKF